MGGPLSLKRLAITSGLDGGPLRQRRRERRG